MNGLLTLSSGERSERPPSLLTESPMGMGIFSLRATRIRTESLTQIPRLSPLRERTQNLWLGGAFATAKPLDFAGDGISPSPKNSSATPRIFSTLPRGVG